MKYYNTVPRKTWKLSHSLSQKGGEGVVKKKSKKIMAFSDSEQFYTKKK